MNGYPGPPPIFETLVQLIISVLFISISATVTPRSLRQLILPTLILPTLVLVAVLAIVARPSGRGARLEGACSESSGVSAEKERGHRPASSVPGDPVIHY